MPRRNAGPKTRRRRTKPQLNRAGTCDTARVLTRTFIAEAFQDRRDYLRATGYTGPIRGR